MTIKISLRTNPVKNMMNSQEQAPNKSLSQQLQTASLNMTIHISMNSNQQQYTQAISKS